MIVHCPNCNLTIDCLEIGNYERVGDPFPDKFTLLKCVKCFNPILVIQDSIIEFGEWGYNEPKVLYPIKDYHINPAIPELLRKALFEVITCIRSGAYTSTVIMCRRALEGFAYLNGIEGKNLKEAILELSKKNVINKQLCEWADELRISGNEAAHNINVEFSSTDAKDIVDFTIAILDFTYSYSIKFEEFKRRKLMVQTTKSTL